MNTPNPLNRDAILAATGNGYQVVDHYLAKHFPDGRIEAGRNISNPFLSQRQRTPSFNVYPDDSGVWRYKDFANADYSGDVFDLVAQLSGLNVKSDFPKVLQRIGDDLGLAADTGKPRATVERKAFTLVPKEFDQAELDFWAQYGITPDTLDRFGVRSLKSYTARARNGQTYTVTASEASPAFIYPYGPDTFKVYRPFASSAADKFRFLGEKPADSVWGWHQLPERVETIILAAGEKDALTAAANGFYAVTLNSETARLNPATVAALLDRAERVVCCYDSDETGRTSAARIESEYGITSVYLPAWIADGDGKDLSDFFKLGGRAEEFRELIAEAIARAKLPVPADVNQVVEVNAVNGVKGSDLFETVDAVALLKMEFSEPEWIIEEILPPGLAILGGRPKHGKSWLALNLAIAAANGRRACGRFQATECETLYLALEDNNRRLQNRLKMILTAEQERTPERLHFKTMFRRFDSGGFDDLREYLTGRPDTRLVIIDTLAKLRGRQKGGKDSYAGDYQELGELQTIALQFKVAILLVHHTTKVEFADPFDAISGTSGISGAADTLFVLKREPFGVTLYTRGRDIDEAEIAMKFDKQTGVWSAIGNAVDARLSDQRRKILEAIGEGESLSPKEIAEASGLPAGSVRHLVRKMAIDGLLISDRSKYSKPLHSVHSVHSGNSVLPGSSSDRG